MCNECQLKEFFHKRLLLDMKHFVIVNTFTCVAQNETLLRPVRSRLLTPEPPGTSRDSLRIGAEGPPRPDPQGRATQRSGTIYMFEFKFTFIVNVKTFTSRMRDCERNHFHLNCKHRLLLLVNTFTILFSSFLL